jgi:pyruvate/2-oxoglutarate dehydrogenase complex dihydrolipoamide acyltransferase (E2) component
MQRGAIAAWRVKEGGAFPQYTILCEVSTTELVEPIFAIDAFAGRVRMLVEAQQAGIVVRFLRQPGQDDDANDLPVGTPLAVVVAEDDLDDAEDDAARQEMLEAARAWEVPTTDVLDDAQPRVPVLEWQSFLAEGGGGEGGAGGGGGGGGGCM